MRLIYQSLFVCTSLFLAACGPKLDPNSAEGIFKRTSDNFETYVEHLEKSETKKQALAAVEEIEKLAAERLAIKEEIWAADQQIYLKYTQLDNTKGRITTLRSRYKEQLLRLRKNPSLNAILRPAIRTYEDARSTVVD